MRENLLELQAGCNILCATPGRLKHLIQSNLVKFKIFKLSCFIFRMYILYNIIMNRKVITNCAVCSFYCFLCFKKKIFD